MHERLQASARGALLQKFGYLQLLNHVENPNNGKKSVNLKTLPCEIEDVQFLWEKVVGEILCERISRSTKVEEIPKQKETSNISDFIEFISTKCCKSNSRQLQWSVISCPRGVQFPLHAHPNIELIYCLRGELFELRMRGEPITRTFEKYKTADDSANNTNVVGPNMTDVMRTWSFGTLKAGEWLVNEVGSVHKSFTSVRSDGGCDLLVLWGGSHANILHPPVTPNIQKAVDTIEDKQRIDDTCCMNNIHQIVPETFLPDSERFKE